MGLIWLMCQTYSAYGQNMKRACSARRPNIFCPRAEHTLPAGRICFCPWAGFSAHGPIIPPTGQFCLAYGRSIRPGALAARQTKPCNISHEYTNDVTLKTFYRHNLVIHIAPINISSPLYFHSVSQISIVHQ